MAVFSNVIGRNSADKKKLNVAMEAVCVNFPYLSGLASLTEICVDSRCESAGVWASGRMAIGERFLDLLTPNELVFVLAHELFHLSLKTHERQDESDDAILFNVAHDYIINEILTEELDFFRPPRSGLHWKDFCFGFHVKNPKKYLKSASKYSLEELVVLLKPWRDILNPPWRGDCDCVNVFSGNSLGSLLADAGITSNASSPYKSDVYSSETEGQFFPNSSPKEICERKTKINEQVVRSYAESALLQRCNRIESDYWKK